MNKRRIGNAKNLINAAAFNQINTIGRILNHPYNACSSSIYNHRELGDPFGPFSDYERTRQNGQAKLWGQ